MDSTECFPAVLDELCSSSLGTCVTMPGNACRPVGSGILEDEQRDQMSSVMARHGGISLGVNYMIDQEKTVW